MYFLNSNCLNKEKGDCYLILEILSIYIQIFNIDICFISLTLNFNISVDEMYLIY